MKSEAMRATLRVTKALSDLQRVRILMMLQPGELCVCQIVEVLRLAPSTVSKHLSLLDAAGLVESRKEGRWMHYRLPERSAAGGVRPMLNWMGKALKNDAGTRQDALTLKRVLACNPETICRRQRQRE